MVAEVGKRDKFHLIAWHPRMETAPCPENEQPKSSESLSCQQAGPIIAWE